MNKYYIILLNFLVIFYFGEKLNAFSLIEGCSQKIISLLSKKIVSSSLEQRKKILFLLPYSINIFVPLILFFPIFNFKFFSFLRLNENWTSIYKEMMKK